MMLRSTKEPVYQLGILELISKLFTFGSKRDITT